MGFLINIVRDSRLRILPRSYAVAVPPADAPVGAGAVPGRRIDPSAAPRPAASPGAPALPSAPADPDISLDQATDPGPGVQYSYRPVVAQTGEATASQQAPASPSPALGSPLADNAVTHQVSPLSRPLSRSLSSEPRAGIESVDPGQSQTAMELEAATQSSPPETSPTPAVGLPGDPAPGAVGDPPAPGAVGDPPAPLAAHGPEPAVAQPRERHPSAGAAGPPPAASAVAADTGADTVAVAADTGTDAVADRPTAAGTPPTPVTIPQEPVHVVPASLSTAPARPAFAANPAPSPSATPTAPQVRIGQVTVVVEGPNPAPARTRPSAPVGPGARQLLRSL